MNDDPNREVSAVHDNWRTVDEEIRFMQSLLGVVPDGFIGPLTRAAAVKGTDTGSNREILTAIENLKGELMERMDELNAKFDKFKVANDEYIAQLKRNIAAEIEAAVAADDAAEQPGIASLGEKIQAAIDALSPPVMSNL